MATIRRTRTALTVALTASVTVLLAAGCTTTEPAPSAGPSTSPSPQRKLSTPDTLLGMPKSTSRELTGAARSQLDQLKREVGTPTSAVGWAYGGETPDADVVYVSGASGTVSDPSGALGRALGVYRITGTEPVDAGPLGGEARCGQGRTEDGSYLTVCGWADAETLGVVGFTSTRPQADRTADFHAVRSALAQPVA
jgi:hypothetical protein